MDEAIKIEFDNIKTAINELKETMQKLLDREEARISRMNEVELSVAMLEKDETACRASTRKEIETIYETIRQARADFDQKIDAVKAIIPTAEKTRRSLSDWMDFLLKLGKFLFWIFGAIVVLVMGLHNVGLIK